MTSRQELAEQLLDVLDVAPEPLVVIGRDRRYLYANDAARALLRLAADSVGEDARVLHPDLTGGELAAAVCRVLDGAPPEVVDLHYPALGTELRARVMPVADGVAIALRDVTDPRGPGFRLLREPDLYQQVLDHVSAGVTFADPHGRILLVNQAAAKLLGRPADEMLGRNTDDLFEPEVAADVRAARQQAEGSGSAVELVALEAWLRERGRDVVAHAFPVYDRSGELIGRGGVATDVTDLLRAERERAASEERYRAIFTGSSLALLVAQPRGLILEANAAACKLLGYSRAQLLTMSPRELVGDDPETVERWRARMLVEGRLGFEAEEEYLRSDGSRVPVLLTVKLIDDPDGGELISLVARDQSRLKELQAELVRAERREAAGRLAAGVAHDANNILAAVHGFAQMLRREVADNPIAQRHVDGIFRSVDRAGDMVGQLLAFTSGQQLEARDVDLAVLVEEQEEMLRRLLPQEISLTVDLLPAPTRADPTQVGRVLLNLVVNAREAAGGSGAIRIRTGTQVLDDDETAAGEYAVLTVTDDGCGMKPDVAHRCFEPFFTTRRGGGGTGLGLSTAHGIARQSGGDLRVRTAPGEGAEFRLLLPRDSGAAAPAPAVSAAAATLAPALVLVVDDDISVRHFVRDVLRRDGCRVVEAGDGQEALAVAMAASGVDLLVTDLQMPHLDGLSLTATLHKTSPGLPVVLMSGIAQPPSDASTPFLRKPFSEEQLRAAVATALQARA